VLVRFLKDFQEIKKRDEGIAFVGGHKMMMGS
jgi:hypothetical protein